MKKSNFKIALLLSLIIVAVSVMFAVSFDFNKVYAEGETYTIQITCDEEHGSVSISPQKDSYEAGENIKIKINQEDTYAYNVELFDGVNTRLYNYEYEEDAKTEIDYTINSNISLNVTFTKTYLVEFYNYRDENTNELTELLFSKRMRENTTIGDYPNSIPARVVPNEFAGYYSWSFVKWAPDVTSATLVVGDMQYYGVYQKNATKYYVGFFDYDDTYISSKYYYYGDVVEFPTIPTREPTDEYYYQFVKWGNDVQKYAVSSKSYTAVYKEIKRSYVVSTSCSAGGSVSIDNLSSEYEYGSTLKLNINPENGYKVKSIQGVELNENNEFTVVGKTSIYVEFEKVYIAVVNEENDIVIMVDSRFGNDFDLNITVIDPNLESGLKINDVNILKILKIDIHNKNGEKIKNVNTIKIKIPNDSDSLKLVVYLYNPETKETKLIESAVNDGYLDINSVDLSYEIIVCEKIIIDEQARIAMIVMSICFSVSALVLTVLCGFLVYKKKAI